MVSIARDSWNRSGAYSVGQPCKYAETELMESKEMIVLEWRFSPPDYFEEQINLKRDDYELIIGRGEAQAKIRAEVYARIPTMEEDLHEALNNRFLGVQLLTHKPYELSEPSMYRIHPDGLKDYFINAKPGVLHIFGDSIDFTLTDKDGNIVRDTQAERIRKKQSLADLSEKFGRADATAKSILKSYKMAVADPDNELVHLYEIRDALAKKFGGERQACNVLDISSRQWSRLGQLANDERLKQGRHRGKSLGDLRDATEAELEEARNIARYFVEAYLTYLEVHDGSVR